MQHKRQYDVSFATLLCRVCVLTELCDWGACTFEKCSTDSMT